MNAYSQTEKEITGYADAMAALKHPDLEQGLYDDGRLVMEDALITLHGEAHSQRRIAEFGVFNKAFFRHYESDVFPRTFKPILQHYLELGHADLVELGYRVTMNLTADFAGIDREDTIEETETLLDLVKTFSSGATLVHSTADREVINARVRAAMETFDSRFLKPSIERRQTLIAEGRELPNDVLSKLLSNSALALTDEVLRREIAFYLQAGAHSTANSTVHALHEILTWCKNRPERRRALASTGFVQRAVHESLRLHPASPVAWRKARCNLTVAGRALTEGERLVINLQAANRDPDVFGDDTDIFNPDRSLPGNVWPYGLSFGYGVHACLGKSLDGGVVPKPDAEHHQQYGIVTLLVDALLKAGAAWIEDNPPQVDVTTSRNNWGYYPVGFAA